MKYLELVRSCVHVPAKTSLFRSPYLVFLVLEGQNVSESSQITVSWTLLLLLLLLSVLIDFSLYDPSLHLLLLPYLVMASMHFVYPLSQWYVSALRSAKGFAAVSSESLCCCLDLLGNALMKTKPTEYRASYAGNRHPLMLVSLTELSVSSLM